MKKTLLILISLVFLTNFIDAQHFSNKQIEMKVENLKKNILNFNASDLSMLEVQNTFCSDYWELNDSNQVQFLGSGKVIFEKLGTSNYKLTHDVFSLEDGEIKKGKQILYFDKQPDLNSIENLDSAQIFLTIDNKELLLFRLINKFSNDLLVLQTTYIDLNLLFGSPLGFVEFNKTYYYYDDKNNLKDESNYALDLFGSGEMIFSDSIHYTNNTKGLAEKSEHYNYNDEDVLALMSYEKHYYNSNNQLIKTEDYQNPEMWTLMARELIEINNSIQVSLSENTFDGGQNWIPKSRDSIYWNKNLKYNFPNRQVNETFANSWQTNSIVSTKDCSGTSNIAEIDDLDIQAGFEGENIELRFDGSISDVNLTLLSINGSVVLTKNYEILPESIQTNKIMPGIYILEIRNKKAKSIQKLVKSF